MNHIVFNWRTKEAVARRVIAEPDGLYVRSDMTFVLGCGGRQCRYVIPAGAYLGKTFKRAPAAREAVRAARLNNGHLAQEAYVAALRADGFRPSVLDLAALYWYRLLA